MCGCWVRWCLLVLVALEWLRMRMQVDWAPWADVVVALGVLGVEDFKDDAGGRSSVGLGLRARLGLGGCGVRGLGGWSW